VGRRLRHHQEIKRMTVSVTPLYAAILTILYIVLSFRVIFIRRGEQISLGDGGNPALRARIRVHGNFNEFAPLGLLLLLMVELQGGNVILLHIIGLMLLAGRACHAWGVSQHPQIMPLRVGGMILTFTALLVAALANLWFALF